MKTVAVTNHKGGSGKTTTAVNLAAALGELGYQVLLIDVDPQGSASSWLGAVDPGRIILDAYLGRADLSGFAISTSARGVQLVPSSRWLAANERQQEIELTIGVIRTIERLPDHWDFVLMDCPPSQGSLAVAPLAVCRYVVVPVEAHVMALQGLVSLMETMRSVQGRLNPDLTLAAIVACRVNRTRHAREVVDLLHDRYPNHVFDTLVRENISLAEAPSFQLPIMRYAPFSTGTEDYRAVANEFLRRERAISAWASATEAMRQARRAR